VSRAGVPRCYPRPRRGGSVFYRTNAYESPMTVLVDGLLLVGVVAGGRVSGLLPLSGQCQKRRETRRRSSRRTTGPALLMRF